MNGIYGASMGLSFIDSGTLFSLGVDPPTLPRISVPGPRPTLVGIGKVGLRDLSCAHFLLPIEDGDHGVPELLHSFVRALCSMVRKRSE